MKGFAPLHAGDPAAYPYTDRQALRVGGNPVITAPRVSGNGATPVMTFRPYRYGLSDPRLRPLVPKRA